MIYLRSILFYIGEGLSTIPFMFISMLAVPLPAKQRSRIIAGWAVFVTWWLKVCCNLDYRISGEKNIPLQPCIFACNHQSTWESITTQTFLPPLAWVLKRELLRIPFFGWGLWATRPIAIDREDRTTARDQVISQGLKILAEGRHVLIFPEGTRIGYGKVGKYKRGAVMLAREAKVDIVPIAHDAGRFWSKSSWWIKPGTIHCVIGESMQVDGLSDEEATSKLKQWITEQGL